MSYLIIVLLIAYGSFEMAQSCGFPMSAPAPTMCCCGGGGGGGGCGRKKRAVQPHFKGSEVPCPQIEWKQIIEGAIIANMLKSTSTDAIQNAMSSRFPDQKFLVTCASFPSQNDKKGIALKSYNHDSYMKEIEELLQFSSAGDGYCNVIAQGKWCQAVALSA